ncbi:AraC family transcriptional regulator [Chitinophaga silvatica]|uniref:AraC family transcriptional regulator n=1 Tax=Chitinophaga silvatica TaxID=2282649 RepID=A0A3E1Y9A4_9BACT|nr:helix-turn-helix domain-containing protein [Chitinophaga silvatica]RFS21998.1 AraC family transcriptional regulator [Chitinophaga silvatica]
MVEIFDNIRQLYNFSRPTPELADYIEFFSESSDEETTRYSANQHFTVKMFQSWTPTIWINLGTSYQIITPNYSQTIAADDDVLVVRNSMVTRFNQPTDHIFTVKFFPGALERILGISQLPFIDQVIPLASVLPSQLIFKIKTAGDFEERITLLQEFFLINVVKQRKNDHYIKFVKDSIDLHHTAGIDYNTGKMAEKMFVTSKTINRYFNNIIGVSPKKYFCVLRARTALGAYVNNKKTFLACNYGYYDMSHFYKEMLKFTGDSMIATH